MIASLQSYSEKVLAKYNLPRKVHDIDASLMGRKEKFMLMENLVPLKLEWSISYGETPEEVFYWNDGTG